MFLLRNGNGRSFCIPGPDPQAKTRNPALARLLIGFFFWGPDPPRQALRASFSRLGPNLAQQIFLFILSPLRFFARFKPIQGIIGQPIQAHSSGPLRFFCTKIFGIFCIKIFGIFLSRYMVANSIQIICNQINPNNRLIINQ